MYFDYHQTEDVEYCSTETEERNRQLTVEIEELQEIVHKNKIEVCRERELKKKAQNMLETAQARLDALKSEHDEVLSYNEHLYNEFRVLQEERRNLQLDLQEETKCKNMAEQQCKMLAKDDEESKEKIERLNKSISELEEKVKDEQRKAEQLESKTREKDLRIQWQQDFIQAQKDQLKLERQERRNSLQCVTLEKDSQIQLQQEIIEAQKDQLKIERQKRHNIRKLYREATAKIYQPQCRTQTDLDAEKAKLERRKNDIKQRSRVQHKSIGQHLETKRPSPGD